MAPETFATLINRKLLVPSSKTTYFAIQRDFLVTLMALTLSHIDVDETWYLDRFPDVAAAIGKGEFTSAADHFVRVGYYEHRMPYPIVVHEEWYLGSYSDVAQAVREGRFINGADHYYREGYREGRYPHPNFHLVTHPSPRHERNEKEP